MKNPTKGEIFVMTVIAGLISSAYAQTAPVPDAPAGQSQTDNKDKDKHAAKPVKAAKADASMSTVTVSGFRSSLALSANEKRDNNGLTDSVFSEDIGKFPDPNIADALSRVPGVQVGRGELDGEGMTISIRGMGANFTRILLNGAPMASASAGSWGGNISANREVDIDFLPSELFRSATVYKSQQADIIEGGIAGTVNMRSVRPFDKSGLRGAFTASGNYRDKDGKWGNTGSGLVSNTWETRFGKVGALAGFAWGDTQFRTNVFQTVDMKNFGLNSKQMNGSDPASLAGNYMTTPATVPSGLPMNLLPAYAQSVLVPGATIDRNMLLTLNPGATIQQLDNGLMGRLPRYLVYEGERKRRGEVLSFQWQPNDRWDLYLDTMFAQKGTVGTQEDMNAGFRSNTPIPIGLTFDNSDCSAYCTITGGTFANTFWSLEYRPLKENTHFRSVNPGFEFHPTDTLTVDGAVNYTDSSFYRDMPSVLVATRSASSVVNYDNSNPGQIPVMTSNVNLNDPSAFGWYQGAQNLSGVRQDLFRRSNTTKGARLNLNWGDDSFSIKFGGTLDDISRRYTEYTNSDAWLNYTCGNNVSYPFYSPNSAYKNTGGCDGTSTPGASAASQYPGYGTGWTAGQTAPLTYLGSAVTNADMSKYVHSSDHGFVTIDWNKFAKDTNYQYFDDNITNVPGSGGYLREKVGGFYLETNGKLPVFGHTLRYNAGVRYAETEQTIGIPASVADPRNKAESLANGGLYPNQMVWSYETTRYHNTMPSMNLSYNLTKDLIGRLSASKSMTRANPADLKQTQLTLTDPSVGVGQISNPDLKPFQSNNLDLALEYYTSREGYVALSAFGKDLISRPGSMVVDYTLAQLQQMFGTIYLSSSQQQTVDAAGGPSQKHVLVTVPYNIDTKLKVRGLEFTWQQPLDMLPVKGFGFTGNVTYVHQKDDAANAPPVTGVPPRTNNLTLYYERNGVNARISRQYTATQVTNTAPGLAPGVYYYSTSRSQVDLSAGLNLQKMFGFRYNSELTLSVWNLNRAKSQTYAQFTDAVFDQNDPGRSYTLMLRTSF